VSPSESRHTCHSHHFGHPALSLSREQDFTERRRKNYDEAHHWNTSDWLAARLELLKAEKELTRRSDDLARQRQELPWVPIDKEYHSTPMRGAPRWRTSSEGARSSSFTTSCSARLHGGLSVLLIDRGWFNGIDVHLATTM